MRQETKKEDEAVLLSGRQLAKVGTPLSFDI